MAMPARNKNSDKYPPMLPETRKLLEDFYRPYNEKLAQVCPGPSWPHPPITPQARSQPPLHTYSAPLHPYLASLPCTLT